jgi:hypothetical protein
MEKLLTGKLLLITLVITLGLLGLLLMPHQPIA